jgi:hypothetical protein
VFIQSKEELSHYAPLLGISFKTPGGPGQKPAPENAHGIFKKKKKPTAGTRPEGF